jgi:hypothetical protein
LTTTRCPWSPTRVRDESDLEGSSSTFDASVGSKDWTVETLVSQMRKGRIDLDPSFQRRNAWLGNRKSRLIESIMLGFPIPQIVLAEKPDMPGHYFVLDGKQRLLALRQFFVDPHDSRDAGFTALKLSSLEVLSELNRKDAQALERVRPDLYAALENHSIRTVVLGQWNSERLLLSLFLRLNTGSVMLSPQELRQALIPGKFIHWLDQTSGALAPMRLLLGNTHADRRMVDAELTLRHLAFATSPVAYRGNLKQFLDDTSKIYNKDWDRLQLYAEAAVAEMSTALQFGFDILGSPYLARKWSGHKFERAINRAVFDVQVYSFSLPTIRHALSGRSEAVIEAYKRLCETDDNFMRSITTTTKTADAFITRHHGWMRVVSDVCGETYPLPAALYRN